MNDQGGKTNQRKRCPSPRRRKRRFHLKTKRRTKNVNEIKARKPPSIDHQVVGRGLVQDQMNAMIVDHGNEMKVRTVDSPRETHLQNGTLMIRIAKDPKGTRRLQDETLIAKGDDTKVAMTTEERDETELHKKGNVEEKKITGKETETVGKNKMAFEVIDS